MRRRALVPYRRLRRNRLTCYKCWELAARKRIIPGKYCPLRHSFPSSATMPGRHGATRFQSTTAPASWPVCERKLKAPRASARLRFTKPKVTNAPRIRCFKATPDTNFGKWAASPFSRKVTAYRARPPDPGVPLRGRAGRGAAHAPLSLSASGSPHPRSSLFGLSSS
jgi:hypothetical protein